MHLDPIGSDEPSREFAAEEIIARRDGEREGRADREVQDREADDPEGHHDEERVRPGREGLPRRFRMRHGRHYVDELLGDAPIRTVREIPISEIEPPPDEALDLDRLESSIRRLGVMEPLIVARRGLEYRVIAGMRRLRAARTAGLNTVPCLVHEVDDDKLGAMRDAASDRLPVAMHVELSPASAASAAQRDAVQDTEVDASYPAVPDTPLSPDTQVDDDLSFLSALLPAKGPGVDERLRLAVLTELAGVELFRAKIASAAMDALTRTTPVERSPVSCSALVDEALSAVSSEARLRGVALEKIGPSPDCTISLDAAGCRIALTGLLQALLTLTSSRPAALQVRTHVTNVRPALIVDCVLRSGDSDLSAIPDDARSRFFDPDWREHPCGEAGARVLAALARTARAHGGRVQAGPGGVTFVVPRPLTDY